MQNVEDTKFVTVRRIKAKRDFETYNFRVLVMKGEKQWIAQALNKDVAAQGSTREAALESFDRTVQAQILIDKCDGREAFTGIKPAPEWYWLEAKKARVLL